MGGENFYSKFMKENMKQNKSDFFGKDRSELVVRYVIDDTYKLDFDLNDVHCWIVEFGTLYVKHKEGDEYCEYQPSFMYMNDYDQPLRFPDMTIIKSIKNG
jgi:hypothetical protein